MSDPEFNLHNPQPLLTVISGPSGVGKDSVLQGLKKRSLPMHFVVTATTRPRRENEVNGVDYFFAQNWTNATLNVTGVAPMNQISFAVSSSSYASQRMSSLA